MRNRRKQKRTSSKRKENADIPGLIFNTKMAPLSRNEGKFRNSSLPNKTAPMFKTMQDVRNWEGQIKEPLMTASIAPTGNAADMEMALKRHYRQHRASERLM